MATAKPISELSSFAERGGTSLLVFLGAMPQEQLEGVLTNLSSSFASDEVLIVAPEGFPAESYPHLRMVSAPPANPSLTLTAADFANAHNLAEKNDARAILMLGQEAGSLHSSALQDLANSVLASNSDLAMPCYDLPSRAGLVNSAILYPLTRALFVSRVRFPLAIDVGLSPRMAERLAGAAQRFTNLNQAAAIVWPVNEASVAGYTVTEFDVGPRTLPQPTDPDINAILTAVTGSLFADIDAKASFWQRARQLPPQRNSISQTTTAETPVDIVPMLDAFRLAYTNLHEIWSLVLPPNSLLGLKRLSVTDAAAFRMPDNLWARIVFDFLLAYRLRTINRGHLLGALIPLYLAWVAGHINTCASGTNAERHIEAVAAAFEADKPYLVARWRWPDRFNP
jgi:hypothetical protein